MCKCFSGLLISTSSMFARPSQIFRQLEVPSSSTQVVEQKNGCSSFFRWNFQLPMAKSKSCCPSRKAPYFDASFVGETACAHVRLDCEKRNATAATVQRLIRPRKVIVRFFYVLRVF